MVLIIGAGLAGLTSAKILQEKNIPFLLLDAAATVGGRLATTVTPDGFHLDHGFQVLLDSYPAARRHLNLKKLAPCYFDSGALLADDGQKWPAMHPLRHPWRGFTSAFANYAPWSDKLRLVHLATELLLSKNDNLLREDARGLSTGDFLRLKNFSPALIERFFRPFFGGVLIDDALETSAALFRYYFRQFILGRALIPANGIAEIPRQLALALPSESLRLQCAVAKLTFQGATLTSGEFLPASQIILATTGAEAARLLGSTPPPAPRKLSVAYFTSPEPLNDCRMLILPAGKSRLVRHFVQLTNIAPSLAPAGQCLLSATLLDRRGLDDASLFAAATQEISEVYPNAGKILCPLRIIDVPYAVPEQKPGFLSQRVTPSLPAHLHLAGDHTLHGSVQGAMESGERAAQAVLKYLT